jgi:hypothetical protein
MPMIDSQFVTCHTIGMKVAVSIPDPIFAEAEALAKLSRLSRSGLYSRALSAYVASHAPDRITELANAAADALSANDLAQDRVVEQAAYRSILKQTEW